MNTIDLTGEATFHFGETESLRMIVGCSVQAGPDVVTVLWLEGDHAPTITDPTGWGFWNAPRDARAITGVDGSDRSVLTAIATTELGVNR